MPNTIAAYIAEVRHLLAHTQAPSLPAEPEGLREIQKGAIRWVPAKAPSQAAVPLKQAQDEILQAMREYVQARRRKRFLMVKGQPGVGKTYLASKVAQELARQGQRVMFLMPNKAHYGNLAGFDLFDDREWYQWQAYNSPSLLQPDQAMLACFAFACQQMATGRL